MHINILRSSLLYHPPSHNARPPPPSIFFLVCGAWHHGQKGWSALINAAWMGHTAVLEALLAAGCKKTHMDLQVGMGSALHRAAYKGHTAVVKSLLAAGCNKNLQNRVRA